MRFSGQLAIKALRGGQRIHRKPRRTSLGRLLCRLLVGFGVDVEFSAGEIDGGGVLKEGARTGVAGKLEKLWECRHGKVSRHAGAAGIERGDRLPRGG